jgi:hypothetical protein
MNDIKADFCLFVCLSLLLSPFCVCNAHPSVVLKGQHREMVFWTILTNLDWNIFDFGPKLAEIKKFFMLSLLRIMKYVFELPKPVFS